MKMSPEVQRDAVSEGFALGLYILDHGTLFHIMMGEPDLLTRALEASWNQWQYRDRFPTVERDFRGGKPVLAIATHLTDKSRAQAFYWEKGKCISLYDEREWPFEGVAEQIPGGVPEEGWMSLAQTFIQWVVLRPDLPQFSLGENSSDESDPAAEKPAEVQPNEVKRRGFKWGTVAFPLGISIGFLGGLFSGSLDLFSWFDTNLSLKINSITLTQPWATVITGIAALGAAGLAFYNSSRTRVQERKNLGEIGRREFEKSLRDRFFMITETLSESTNYVKREAGVYALVALMEDWAAHYQDSPVKALREQQTCLDVIVGQLRDEIKATPHPQNHEISTKEDNDRARKPVQYDSELLSFKRRIQEILIDHFTPSPGEELAQWSYLDLDLSNSQLIDLKFDCAVFRGEVKVTDTFFTGSCSFLNSHFHSLFLFNQPICSGDVLFDGSVFHREARFIGTVSPHKVSFEGTHFHQDVSFDKQSFSNEVSFEGAIFYQEARFIGTVFPQKVSFEETHFHQDVSFDEQPFSNEVSFEGAIFYQEARFIGTVFPQKSSFQGVQFKKFANFRDAEFKGDAWFIDTHFRAVSFRYVHFHQAAWFEIATFHETSDFTGAQFIKAARFDEAHFLEDALFPQAHFWGLAEFYRARFYRLADFSRTHFHNTAKFYDARLNKRAVFTKAQFCDSIWFPIKPSKGMFTQATFSKEKSSILDQDTEGILDDAMFSISCPY